MALLSSSTPVRTVGLRKASRSPLAPWLYLIPALLTLTIWVYWPLVDAFRLSFYRWNMLPTAPQVFVGWDNYLRIFSLPKFWQALSNTGIYVLGLLPLSVLIPLALAIYTHDLPARARTVYRAIIFVPMIIAPVVAAALWRWLLDPGYGLVNTVLQILGLGPVKFLTDPSLAIWTVIGITGWKLIGFSTLILSAANANINPSLIEAARMDGANQWEIIRDVRLPLLRSSVLFLVMMTILLGAQWSFTYINVLTGGGPLGATSNIYYLLWDFGFSSMSVGWSSAAAVILFLGFSVVAFVLFRLIDRYSFHDN
ncbi:carbohydrate ABC transporter permease [Brucella haematophila]|jgi:multiple sugar transport system permease protein|uniref:Sugar ABC transporter permease n=1 Tax=Brucella haematophila TaxID=419474 RepID=A0ABX1DR34_9HYPH|nr:sugar ABC transporter permease [Brucella haematophila]NKC05021.1 sugar ABC transporter permease [Brucella haematophila]TMV04454.1 sugar ABC transporter permease [Brucella haematophila]